MSREVKSYLLENYLPSTLFVSISWGSFVVVPEIVPGRMVLLVTTLLSLVTMFDTVSNNSPDALELKCIEVGVAAKCLVVAHLASFRFIRSAGLADLLHVVRLPRPDGVFYRPLRDPLRQALAHREERHGQ